MEQIALITTPIPKLTREAGAQPIVGYRLIEPLGQGGFGEVWKCEAPGGLFKAIKFVDDIDELGGAASQERKALQLIKTLRHPFILSLDRIEVVDDVLVIVMELADKSLHGLLGDYQSQNRAGIPREELLGYLLEAAEALDWMNFGHALQHLDIKPHNLFLISNHLKVADFGLVDRLSDAARSRHSMRQGGMTPMYAAPELLSGTVSRHCDQYSLAIIYQQLLTGTLPFWSKNLFDIMIMHKTAEPTLTPLPKADRPVVARALSKCAADRFPSCLDFLQALVCGGESSAKIDLPRRASAVKKLMSALHPEEKPTKSFRRAAAVTEPTPRPPIPPSMVRGPAPVGPQKVRESTAPTPHRVSLPGYRFLHRVSGNSLGDVWAIVDELDRPRRAFCLNGFVERDATLLERLRSFNHRGLSPTEAAWSACGRLVLVAEVLPASLRDRLETCQKQGLPGIPREELLGYLRFAAETLDTLHERHGLSHLGLNPSTLVIGAETIQITDFGLVPLIWLPTGQSGAALNGRYAAPELSVRPEPTSEPALFRKVDSASDQYSLALIYTEMLSGIPPRSPRSGSGVHRKVGRADPRITPTPGQLRVDMDWLPACDRDILLRALCDDPAQRFDSCAALIEALEATASKNPRREYLYRRLPPVIPFTCLEGEPPPRDMVFPPANQLAIELATPHLSAIGPSRTILGPQNVRYTLQTSDVWECKCPMQYFASILPLKVDGFRCEWQARMVHSKGDSFLLHMELPPRGLGGEPANALPLGVSFELDVQAASGSMKHFAEARMRVHPAEAGDERVARLLPQLAPSLFDSMRCYLQASPEQRSEDRWHCPQPLHVYPVLPDLEVDEILDGISRNISLRGVGFRVAKLPRAEMVYLHWHKSATASPYAVLARILRVQAMAGGGFEVGADFPT